MQETGEPRTMCAEYGKYSRRYEVTIGKTTYIVSNYYEGTADVSERIGNLIRNASTESEKDSVDVSADYRYSVAETAVPGKENV